MGLFVLLYCERFGGYPLAKIAVFRASAVQHEPGVRAKEQRLLRFLWLAPAGAGPVAAAKQLPRPGRLRLRLRP